MGVSYELSEKTTVYGSFRTDFNMARRVIGRVAVLADLQGYSDRDRGAQARYLPSAKAEAHAMSLSP